MNKAVIFFFSGTGNTWWVTEEIYGELRKINYSVKKRSIEEVTVEEADLLISGADLAGFGYPIYGSDIPKPMLSFIGALKKVNQQKAFVFCTQWIWSGDGARVAASVLNKKGFTVRWGEHFLMPNNVTVNMIPLPYTNNSSKLNKIRKRAVKRIRHFSEKIATGKKYHRGFCKLSFLLGSVQRVPFRIVFKKLQNDISIDKERCIYCGDCVSLCPAENFYKTEKGISTKGNCILCLRCYNFCPVSAIMYRGRLHQKKRGIPYRGPLESFDPYILKGSDKDKGSPP